MRNFKSFMFVGAMALELSATAFAQSDSTMRRAFTPAFRPSVVAGATSGFSKVLDQQYLMSQSLAGSVSGSSPTIGYGPFVNNSGAPLLLTLSCIAAADHCIMYGGPSTASVRYGNSFQVAPGETFLWMMRDYGYVSISALGSNVTPAMVGLPPASAFQSPTQTGAVNTYQSCVQGGVDNQDQTFTPDGTYIFYYSSVPIRTDKSFVWGGSPITFPGPNPGVSTSTCALGVGTCGPVCRGGI